MKVLSHHYQELIMILMQLLFLTHGVNSASQPCISTPCFIPLAEIETIDQVPSNDEDLTAWDEQPETNELTPFENEDVDSYDNSAGGLDESKDEQEQVRERNKERWRDIKDSQSYGGDYMIPADPREPLVLFISRLSPHEPTRNDCVGSKKKDINCLPRHKVDTVQPYAPLSKRGRINALQKWTSAGLPFSVLYHHHKQASRSKNNAGANGQRPGNAQAAARRSPDNVQWVSQVGPVVTTRKQYSTLPHLFVSYGWGPLGK